MIRFFFAWGKHYLNATKEVLFNGTPRYSMRGCVSVGPLPCFSTKKYIGENDAVLNVQKQKGV